MRPYVHGVARFGIATILVLGLCACSRVKRGPEDLNVVCIVIDTLRADHLPMYGYEQNTAPFIKQLAGKGVVFENAYAASSWTAPSTASLFTSLYPFQHGVVTGMKAARKLRIDLNRIPEEIETLGEVFKRAGYATYAVTDNRNVAEEEGFTQGFDRFKNFHYDGAQRVNRQVLKWKKEMLGNKKYFLYIHYMDPHGPLHEREPWFSEGAKTTSSQLAAYDSEISYVDARIRRLYKALGWDSDTLVIITSDHGQEFKDHGGFGHGRTLYAEVINVPLIVYSSHDDLKFRTGRLSDRISLIDVLPTFADVIGLSPATPCEGKSLVPLLKGQEDKLNEREIYSHLLKFSPSDKARASRRAKKDHTTDSGREIHAVIREGWKYIERTGKPEELYHLGTDSRDQTNLAAEQPELTSALSSNMRLFVEQCAKYEPRNTTITLTEEERERLRSLGYAQ